MSEPVEHVEGQMEIPDLLDGRPWSPAVPTDDHHRHVHWPMPKDDEKND